MSDQAIVEKLKAKFSSEVLDVVEFRGETTVTVKKEPKKDSAAKPTKEVSFEARTFFSRNEDFAVLSAATERQ